MADVRAPKRVEIRVDAQVERAQVEASELGFLGLSKIIEYAAEGAAGPEAVLVVRCSEAGAEAVSISVTGFEKSVSDEDIEGMLVKPGDEAVRDLRWRSGVKLALASAIANAKGWRIKASREGTGVVFEVTVPLAGAK